MDPKMPESYTIDLMGDNGTPFRFMYWPGSGMVRYYDRRYTLTEGEPGYGINHMNEDGQACGPVLTPEVFTQHGGTGMRGWHEVDSWDVDRATMTVVADWLEMIMERDVR